MHGQTHVKTSKNNIEAFISTGPQMCGHIISICDVNGVRLQAFGRQAVADYATRRKVSVSILDCVTGIFL